MWSLVFLLLIFFRGNKAVSAKETKGPFVAPSLVKPLQLRGGAGPLDPTLAAKTYTVVGLIHGYLSNQVPKETIESYGPKDPSALAVAWGQTFGAACASIGIAGLCLFSLKTDVNTAMGCGTLFWVAEHLRAILTDQENKLGADPLGRRMWAAVSTFCAYALLTNKDYASLLIKVVSVLYTATSALAVFDPAAGAALYGFKNLSPVELMLVRVASFLLVENGVLQFALASGMDPLKALGYAEIVAFLQCFSFAFVTKEVEKNKMDKGAMVFWMLFHAVVIATLAF